MEETFETKDYKTFTLKKDLNGTEISYVFLVKNDLDKVTTQRFRKCMNDNEKHMEFVWGSSISSARRHYLSLINKKFS